MAGKLRIIGKKPVAIGNLGGGIGELYEAFPEKAFGQFFVFPIYDNISIVRGNYLIYGENGKNYVGFNEGCHFSDDFYNLRDELVQIKLSAVPDETTLRYLQKKLVENEMSHITAKVVGGKGIIPDSSILPLYFIEKIP